MKLALAMIASNGSNFPPPTWNMREGTWIQKKLDCKLKYGLNTPNILNHDLESQTISEIDGQPDISTGPPPIITSMCKSAPKTLVSTNSTEIAL